MTFAVVFVGVWVGLAGTMGYWAIDEILAVRKRKCRDKQR
jgi:hypothetical protein